MASVETDVRWLTKQVDQLSNILVDIENLDYLHRKLIAETILLRFFYALDICVESVALKLASGVLYADGTAPLLIYPAARSAGQARSFILGARRGPVYLKWTTLRDINSNLARILDPRDHFMVHRTTHDAVYESMRHVRNHIAHGTRSTANKFAVVVSSVYGGPKRGISPAKLLLSKRAAVLGISPPVKICVLEQYLSWGKTFFKTLCKA